MWVDMRREAELKTAEGLAAGETASLNEGLTMNDIFEQEIMKRTVASVIQVVDDNIDTLKRGGGTNRLAIISASAIPAIEAMIFSMNLNKAIAYMAVLMISRERSRRGKGNPGDEVSEEFMDEVALALQEPIRKAVEL